MPIIYENPGNDTIRKKIGPNRTHFIHPYIELNFACSEENNNLSKINYFSSNGLNLGVKYKLKLLKPISIGLDLSYRSTNFYLKQNAERIALTSIKYKYESINFNNRLGLGAFLRINYTKRGNYLGKYIESELVYDYSFNMKYKVKYSNANSTEKKITNYRNTIYNDINYYLNLKFGFNKFALICEYRISDLFKNNNIFYELPRYNLGIQYAIF